MHGVAPMPERPPSRDSRKGRQAPREPFTLIGPGCLFRGELILDGDVILHGRIEGTLFTDGDVLVAEDGSVEGGIHARSVTVEGSCRGRIEALYAVLLRGRAVVHAEVDAPALDMEYGARFTGRRLPTSGSDPTPRIRAYRQTSPGRA